MIQLKCTDISLIHRWLDDAVIVWNYLNCKLDINKSIALALLLKHVCAHANESDPCDF